MTLLVRCVFRVHSARRAAGLMGEGARRGPGRGLLVRGRSGRPGMGEDQGKGEGCRKNRRGFQGGRIGYIIPIPNQYGVSEKRRHTFYRTAVEHI